ncbi:MAG: hypothetical protein KDA25_00160 [Phycisphaerales bacterium]|nr:hypothetical protein [Phycisphaerales bacterium]
MASADAAVRDAQDRFIAAWAQMGSAWGIPRTMAEVHALLYIHGEAMNTDDVMARLAVSRGNVSMTLRALVDWGIVFRVHHRGDRKDYFVAEQDVWKLFRTIIRERKKREFDPLLDALRDCRDLGGAARAPAGREHTARVDELLDFIEMVDRISERFISPTGIGLQVAARLLGKVS